MPHEVDKKDPEDPSTTSMAWDAMSPKWALMETLLAGTSAMRDARDAYLPLHEEESPENYDRRINRTFLFNMIKLTLDSLVGKPFEEPMKLNDDVPEPIKELSDDIDLLGNDVSTFCRNWFREGLSKAFAHVLVDFPVMTEEERTGRTLQDDRDENRRPYWLFVKPENLIFAASETVNGREVLTHIRIAETVIERVGFAEEVTQRIRVLEPGTFQVWDLVPESKKNKKKVWKKTSEGETGIDVIPLITFYADNRDGLMLAQPPLEDLAHLNIAHWQSTADQRNVLTVARFPMLAVAGAHDQSGTSMRIGPKQLLGTRAENGRFYYVEHSGKAIAAGRDDLQDLEQLMASYGAEFLRRRPGGQTATARALDSAEATSPLQDSVNRFIDAVASALDLTARWLDLAEKGGTVDLNTDFTPSEKEEVDMNALIEARKNGDISREDFLSELKRRQVLSDDFDITANIMRLLMEVAIGADKPGANDEPAGRRSGEDANGDE